MWLRGATARSDEQASPSRNSPAWSQSNAALFRTLRHFWRSEASLVRAARPEAARTPTVCRTSRSVTAREGVATCAATTAPKGEPFLPKMSGRLKATGPRNGTQRRMPHRSDMV